MILPDHIHLIINSGTNNISDIVYNFKIRYSRLYRDRYGAGRVWQNRFWDHTIRDQGDFNRHLDYIHYNPVKHGLINDPHLYRYSSLKEWYNRGYYQRDWGVKEIEFNEQFGE